MLVPRRCYASTAHRASGHRYAMPVQLLHRALIADRRCQHCLRKADTLCQYCGHAPSVPLIQCVSTVSVTKIRQVSAADMFRQYR
eukprot:2695223-Rhodomonas_salina.1